MFEMSFSYYPTLKPRCIICTLQTALKFVDLSIRSEEEKEKAFNAILSLVSDKLGRRVLPARLANEIFRVIKERSGVEDPLRGIREKVNSLALKACKPIRDHVYRANGLEEKLRRALIASITGNIIDFGIADHKFDVNQLYKAYLRNLKQNLAVDETDLLISNLKGSKKALIIGDNIGEVALDKILLELLSELGLKLFYSVRGAPISGDSTIKDAKQVGIDEHAEIISTGLSEIGVDLGRASHEFISAFKESNIVLAKGQSNFETLIYQLNNLSSFPSMVFSVFKVKCPVIAEFLHVNVGGNIVKLLGKVVK